MTLNRMEKEAVSQFLKISADLLAPVYNLSARFYQQLSDDMVRMGDFVSSKGDREMAAKIFDIAYAAPDADRAFIAQNLRHLATAVAMS